MDEARAESGYEDLVRTFEKIEYPVPPVPEAFRPVLRRPGEKWLWTTRDIDPFEMYMFNAYRDEVLQGPIDDYLAIAHAGHGLASWGLNYHLVHGPVAVFCQDGFGSVLRPVSEDRKHVIPTFRGIQRVLDEVAALRERRPDLRRPVLMLVWSSFRGNCELSPLRPWGMNLEGVAWKHEGPFSGMGWRPTQRADGSALAWRPGDFREDLFAEAVEMLARL